MCQTRFRACVAQFHCAYVYTFNSFFLHFVLFCLVLDLVLRDLVCSFFVLFFNWIGMHLNVH